MSAFHRVNVSVVNVKNRREVMLECPPFCKDPQTWREAVNQTRRRIREGSKAEPFLLAAQIYAELGGPIL